MPENNNRKHILFITGAGGYVGGMLCDQFSKRADVKRVVALDKESMPSSLKGNKKVVWVRENTANNRWQEKVRQYNPTVVIHCAWQIRELYGKKDVQWKWNVEGANNVFTFTFNTPSVHKLIYFSSAAVYGAYRSNTIERHFTEDDSMREEEYSYGKEKKYVEEHLHRRWEEEHAKDTTPQVFTLRPAAITGPRGRFMHIRFGLQSALAGQLKGNIFYRIVSVMVSFVPATPWWVRQFIHEDDITDIVEKLTFEDVSGDYEVFNLVPPGEPVIAAQMADAVGKRVLRIWPWMVRAAFFIFWHLSRGKIPNSRGVWRFYSYPIVMDGSKFTRMYGYNYKYQSDEAFRYTNGRYESYVPEEKRKHKT